MLPGFVDTHVHYPQTRIIGRATGPLLRWLEQSVFPEEARFARRPYASAVADEMIDRMLAAGTTCAAIFSSSNPAATEVLLGRLAERGLRGAVGLTLMDVRSPKALSLSRDAAMTACRKLIRRWHQHDDGRLEVAITPRFALSCSRAMLRAAGRLAAEHGLLVQTHIAETEEELAATRAAHRDASDYLDVYDRAGLLGERTVLAHAIHLSPREWDRVRDAGARIAHCPDSNFFLGSGRMPLSEAHDRGILVGLGSDVAAGRSFSMRRAMASAYDNALCLGRSVSLPTLFRMATLDGAGALGLGDRVGSLEAGKDADFVLMRLSEQAKTVEDALAQLVFDNDDLGVEACYVRGQRLS
jgi:guanine deaminase